MRKSKWVEKCLLGDLWGYATGTYKTFRTVSLGTSVDISGGGYHPSPSSFTARLVKK
jgi:hypothetical protein